ncbi:Cytochrome P450 [Dillenia turbinata]|uniref:Cytochrome P450 n=1 Tax=Dillenia turbinata TaxID=194707 RepID=A0AAN8VPA1_9MAGN
MSGEQKLFLFLLPNTTSCTSFGSLIFAFLLFLFFTLYLYPGGPAWALSRNRAAIPGQPGNSLSIFNTRAPHKLLSSLANSLKAKRVMAFSVGFTRFIISSHPNTAKEILNGSAFVNRPIKESAYELLFDRAIGFAPYGEYWRNLRRISSTYLFSPKRIASFEVFRIQIGLTMVGDVKSLMETKRCVEIKKVLHFGSLNNVMKTVFGKCYEFGQNGNGNDVDGVELEKLVSEGYDLLGVFNWSDHFPFLGLLDVQGVRKRCRQLVFMVKVFIGKIIEEHRVKRFGGVFGEESGGDEDFVDVLLGLEKEYNLSDSDMIAILWEMIFRGTDTIAILLEWILARMVLHPDIQWKAQSEIDNLVGTSRPVSDSDIPNLHYLQCIVKETLRMHPPGPLLSWARLAIHDTHVGGHLIPAGTTAMVNMWAITHDEKVWSEPEKFMPERFLDEDISIMGSDLRLAPFGSGRRVCPGKALGLATVHLWLALLLQNFNWVATENGVDLSENLKLSCEMKNPLVCKAISRAA